jgi:hypothetical protein
MIWAKEFDIDMPDNLQSVCQNYMKHFDPEPPFRYKSVVDSKMWVIPPLGINRKRLDDGGANGRLANVRELVTKITGLALEEKTPILAIWKFDENFTSCPIHIDDGGEHTGSIVTCITGKFKLHLHSEDKPGSTILETININKSKLVALNNTVFPHSVEGQGDLIVFGTSKETNPLEYFV